jgi:non-ribosomal peptide synthetase component F
MENVRQALLVTVSGYTPALVELFTDDVVVVSPVLSVRDREELVQQLRRRNHVFSDIEVDVQVTQLADDELLVQWQFSAAHTGRLELPDLSVPATGRTVSLGGLAIARFLGSQIRELRQYWDALSLLRDLDLTNSGLLRSASS